MSDLAKLLDNRWLVLVHRGVDGRYCAAARHAYGETWKDVFETVNQQGNPTGFPTDDFEKLNYSGHRMPNRIAYGDSPEEAMAALVNQVLGLQGADDAR